MVQILNFVVSRIWDGTSQMLDDAIRRTDQWGALLSRFGWRIYALNLLLVGAAIVLPFVAPKSSGISTATVTGLCAVLLSIAALSWSLLLQDLPKFVGLLVLGLVAAPLPLLLALLTLPFGPELAIVSLVLHVTAEPTPPGSWVVCQLKSDVGFDSNVQSRRGLMHSLTYEDPVALDQLAQWLQKRLAAMSEKTDHSGGSSLESRS
jgi:hypothetical protein